MNRRKSFNGKDLAEDHKGGEELDKEWEELKHWNEIGPTVDEYLENLKKYGLYPNETDNNSKK